MNGSAQNPINLNLLKTVHGVKKKKTQNKTETSLFPNHPNKEIWLSLVYSWSFPILQVLTDFIVFPGGKSKRNEMKK